MRKHISKLTPLMVLLGCLMLTASAQGATFDCKKAKSEIEKLICSDEELSKQDEEMTALYARILDTSGNDPVLIKAQRDWLKYREQCFAPIYKRLDTVKLCLSNVYRNHIDILHGSLPTDPNANITSKKLCVHIATLVETGKSINLPRPEYESGLPRETIYKFDIDGDGMKDSVEESCGSAECSVDIKLSSDKTYDLDGLDGGYGFYLIRYQNGVYAIVSYSEDEESTDMAIRNKSHLGRLYLIAPTGAKMVCGK